VLGGGLGGGGARSIYISLASVRARAWRASTCSDIVVLLTCSDIVVFVGYCRVVWANRNLLRHR
jgi:hypothetical protein